MSIMRKTLLLCLAAMIASAAAHAATTVTVGKVVYKLNTTQMTARASSLTCDKDKLTSVTIPSSVTYKNKEYSVVAIGTGCFSFTALTSVTVPEGVETIADGAFSSCEKLKSVKLPSSLTRIENTAFAWGGLEKITIPANVTDIGEMAFYNCTALTKVVFKPDMYMNSIGKQAFCNCHALSFIEMPASLKSIGENAFSNCYLLTSIKFPEGLTKIPFACCWHCDNLQSVRLPNSVEVVEELAFPCPNLTDVNLPSSLRSTGENAFISVRFKKLEFPWRMETIGKGSFATNPYLEEVNIPANVTSIGDYAFNVCPNLKTVIVNNQTPPALGIDGFGDSYDTAHLIAGYFAVSAYRKAPEWKRFKNIYESLSADLTTDDTLSADTSEEYYTLGGTRLPSRPTAPGVYIRRKGTSSSRIIIAR